MPRPRKPRRIRELPPVDFYKPRRVPLSQMQVVALSVDGLEALRLADAEGLDHEAAATAMDVSRSTFTRLVAEARHNVATALANGWALRIDGGHFVVQSEEADRSPGYGFGCGPGRGPGHGKGRGRGRGTNRQQEE